MTIGDGHAAPAEAEAVQGLAVAGVFSAQVDNVGDTALAQLEELVGRELGADEQPRGYAVNATTPRFGDHCSPEPSLESTKHAHPRLPVLTLSIKDTAREGARAGSCL